jgi:carbonic anhydrase
VDLRKGFYAQVFENNRSWIAQKLALDPRYFERLAEGQNPEILYIGCSDSRITAEELMGAEPGDVFVHRNIANLVGATDLSALSVIEYAIAHLGVKHGGGVRALRVRRREGGHAAQGPRHPEPVATQHP